MTPGKEDCFSGRRRAELALLFLFFEKSAHPWMVPVKYVLWPHQSTDLMPSKYGFDATKVRL